MSLCSVPKVLVVEDEPELRSLLGMWLAGAGFAGAVAADACEALAMVKRESFDVVVTDLHMPGFSGHELLALLKELDPTIEVIILTGKATLEDAIGALREERAFDFLQKPIGDMGRLRLAIERAYMRRHRFAPASPTTVSMTLLAGEALSSREREILALLADGLENRAIADRLCLGEKTVRNHLTVIYEKLGVANRTQAALAFQTGLATSMDALR